MADVYTWVTSTPIDTEHICPLESSLLLLSRPPSLPISPTHLPLLIATNRELNLKEPQETIEFCIEIRTLSYR